MLDEINQDYVRTARAKGLSENRIMWVHVLRNASIPIITNLMANLPGLLLGAFLIERFFSIPGIGREVILAVERSDFPGDQGADGLRRVRDDGVQPAGRPDVQGGRSAGPAQVRGTTMATALKSVTPLVREIPHTVSPGLWALAWKRLQSDHVGMVSLAIVAAFIVLMILSGVGLDREGLEPRDRRQLRAAVVHRRRHRGRRAGRARGAAVGADPGVANTSRASSIRSPTCWRKSAARKARAARLPPATKAKTVDPLADVMADIKAGSAKAGAKGAEVVEARAATLPFGGDKWGRDVLKKTIKGSETSIFVGLAAAAVAVFIGTVFGALAGYYGKWVDDFFNWFYSIFSSIPYLLLILAVAAVLQQKGIHTIILILGLTGWTGVFRLIRGEYLKHKAREYVQAADAIGASNARRMFVHIFPNVSHVVLVQLSILTVGFIKAEVILSFLGFGVPVDVVSWGSMLNEAQNELILGKWWQLVAATVAMATLVTAFSLFTDALRDALDPKLKGRMGA